MAVAVDSSTVNVRTYDSASSRNEHGPPENAPIGGLQTWQRASAGCVTGWTNSMVPSSADWREQRGPDTPSGLKAATGCSERRWIQPNQTEPAALWGLVMPSRCARARAFEGMRSDRHVFRSRAPASPIPTPDASLGRSSEPAEGSDEAGCACLRHRLAPLGKPRPPRRAIAGT